MILPWREQGWVGAALLFAACALAQAADPTRSISLQSAADRVPRYEKIEFRIDVAESYNNAFDPDEVDLGVRFTTPTGETVIVPAFWCQAYERQRLGSSDRPRDWFYPDGSASWRARFSPSQTGEYKAVALLKDRKGTLTSSPVRFQCVASSSLGFLRAGRKDSRFFEFSEGKPFFAIGQNLAFIGDQQYVGLSKAEEIFLKLSTNGANYLRVWTCCEDWAMAVEARKSAFGRSWDWRPQIVPLPDDESPGRKCLKLSPDKNTLKVESSHPVALRPGKSYVLCGQARLGGSVSLAIDFKGMKPVSRTASDPGSWQAFRQEFQAADDERWLAPLSFRLEGQGDAWIRDLSLKGAEGGPELLWEADVNRPVRGFYNPVDCFMLDELVSAAEKHGIYLQLCLLTRDLYMSALKDADKPEYGRAISDAKRTFRYAVARWGYSTAVAAWEYWNEMDPGLPTDKFYAAVGDYLETADPYHHLRTTSTWGPSARDCRHPELDLADTHFYLRPPDKARLENEVEAVIDRTRWLREQAPAKPAHLGEFGLANEKWQPTEEMGRSPEIVDMHNALWASALSGASGTAMFWWWERLDQRNFYPHYLPLSRFLADLPWTGGSLRAITLSCSDARVRALSMQTETRAWVWLFNREASWGKIVLEKQQPTAVANATVPVAGLEPRRYTIRWWDTREGRVLREDQNAVQGGVLQLAPPDFTHDIACLVRPGSN